MKATLEKEDIDLIAKKIIETIMPLIKQNEPEEECFLNSDEASRFLGVKKSWLYNNAEKECIPIYKIGGNKFKKSELLKWSHSRQKF